MFADDALLCISKLNFIDAVKCIIWMVMSYISQLKLNCVKTKYMIFDRIYEGYSNIRLKIKEQEIERVDKMKYLGINIDRKLKWDDHIDYAESNIARKMRFMYRLCKYVSKRHKLIIYRSVSEPYFVYSPTILFTLNNAQMRRY